jgi:hypothetical protein
VKDGFPAFSRSTSSATWVFPCPGDLELLENSSSGET